MPSQSIVVLNNNKPTRICSVSRCNREHIAKGFCAGHYQRWKKYGAVGKLKLRLTLPGSTLEEKFLARVRKTNSCWNWTGYIHLKTGYGMFTGGRGRDKKGRLRSGTAHRLSWLLFRGPIPNGLEPDHTCRIRKCVNPAHLELVTHQVNVLRGTSPSAVCAAKTHCDAGHPLSGKNLLRDTGKKKGRRCRTCRNNWYRNRYHNRKHK